MRLIKEETTIILISTSIDPSMHRVSFKLNFDLKTT